MSQVDRAARFLAISELVELGLFHGTSPILTVGAGASAYVTIQTGTAKHMHVYLGFAATAEFIVNIYVSPTITSPGNLLTIANYHFGKPSVATAVLRRDVTISATGTKVGDFLVPGGHSGRNVGGAATNATKLILPPNTLYLMEYANQGVVDEFIEPQFNFHEL